MSNPFLPPFITLDTDASVISCDQTSAGLALAVPELHILATRNAVPEGDGVARVSRVDLDKLLAVVDHARLAGERRSDAVGADLDGIGNGDAGVIVDDQARAGFRLAVPELHILATLNAVPERDRVARVARVDLDEFVAVLDHAWLGRERRGDAVGASGRGGAANDTDASILGIHVSIGFWRV